MEPYNRKINYTEFKHILYTITNDSCYLGQESSIQSYINIAIPILYSILVITFIYLIYQIVKLYRIREKLKKIRHNIFINFIKIKIIEKNEEFKCLKHKKYVTNFSSKSKMELNEFITKKKIN